MIDFLERETGHVFTAIDAWFLKEPRLLAFRGIREEWSISLVLEHLSLANRYLLLLIGKGIRKALQRPDPEAIARCFREYRFSGDLLESIGVNNSFAWECPRHMLPTGDLPAADIRQTIAAQHATCRENIALLRNGEGVLYKTTMSVRSLGKLDLYQYIWFLLLHCRRHLEQMEEIEREYNTTGGGS